jgi:hypothetical protein
MKRNANAAAEVTMMVRLRFVSRYRGMNCEKKSIRSFVFVAKITTNFALISTFGPKNFPIFTLCGEKYRVHWLVHPIVIVKVLVFRLAYE